MKRKRVGAGQRSSSAPNTQTENCVFINQSGKSDVRQIRDRIKDTRTETSPAVSSTVRATASATSLPSPTRARSKKQQKLVEAAKSSRNISEFFTKKQTGEEAGGVLSHTPICDGGQMMEEEEVHEGSPVTSETEDLILLEPETEVIVLSDDNEEEEEEDLAQPNSAPITKPNQPEDEEENDRSNSPLIQQVTDDVKAESSSPPAKRSRPADENKRKVTFNPNVQKKSLQLVSEPPKTVTLKEAADIVVRYLDPFYTQGKFATKELFKSFARYLSHLLAEHCSRGKDQVKAEAKVLIGKFFSRVQRCESEADWKHLKPPHSWKTSESK